MADHGDQGLNSLHARQRPQSGDGPSEVTGGQSVRAYVCAPAQDSRLFVSALPPDNPRGVEVVSFGNDAATLEEDVKQLGVTVVVLSPQVRNYSDDLVARLSHWPELLVVVGLVPPTGDWGRQVTAAGAIDVLRSPVTEQTIDTFVSSVPGWLNQAAKMRSEPGWVAAIPTEVAQAVSAMGYRQGVWACWSPKGGAGKTTVACNTAALLGVVGQRKTLLLDGNMNGGHVDLHMGISADTTIASLAYLYKRRGELLPRQIQEHAVDWHQYLHILSGIQRVEQAGEPPLRGQQGKAFMEELLEVASRMYDFVIVDIGSSVNSPVHRTALTSADGVVVIVTPDRAALIDTKTTLETLSSVMGLERSRYTLVVNMWTPQAGLRRGEITSFVGLPEAGVVPQEGDGRMLLAVNEGRPFALMNLDRKDPEARAIVDAMAGVAAQVYPPLDTIWENRGKGDRSRQKKGLFSKLFD